MCSPIRKRTVAAMQAFRCPICGMSATTRDQMRAHVEEAHLHQARPGQLSGFRRAVTTTRGRILVPVALDHDSTEHLEFVNDLARRAYLTLDFVAVPIGRDDPCVVSVLRAVTEIACGRGVPSARWRLLGPGPLSQRLLDDVREQPPELICLPTDRVGSTFTTVRRRTEELTRRFGVAIDDLASAAAPSLVLAAPADLVDACLTA